jgi:hypothetical protein
MPNQVDVLEAEALELTPEERARLADRLIASLSDDAESEEPWAAEVERRNWGRTCPSSSGCRSNGARP